jgi:hypothetical protein
MSGRHLTQSEYALQHIFVLFGMLLFQLAKTRFTDTYQAVFRFCELDNIDYLGLRYLNTGTQLFKEFPEEWLRDGEV